VRVYFDEGRSNSATGAESWQLLLPFLICVNFKMAGASIDPFKHIRAPKRSPSRRIKSSFNGLL
jgi:hypothetical protein